MQVGLTWTDGVSDGGTAIIDYQVQYKVDNVWVTIATGIKPKSYTTTLSLVAGQSYWFRVISTNSVGTSLESDKEHVPVYILVTFVLRREESPRSFGLEGFGLFNVFVVEFYL